VLKYEIRQVQKMFPSFRDAPEPHSESSGGDEWFDVQRNTCALQDYFQFVHQPFTVERKVKFKSQRPVSASLAGE
jgi:hypothetical protein